MPEQEAHHDIEEVAFGWQMSLFFVALLLVFVYLPIDVELPVSLFAWMFSGVLLAAIYSVRTRRRWRLISLVLAAVSIGLSWGATLLAVPPTWLELSAFSVSALFVIYTMIMIVMRIMQVRLVSIHTISAALSLYLLMGILGGLVYSSLETAVPGSIGSTGGSLLHIDRTVDLFPPLLYFSFTTITTLGFGDVYPVSAAARAFVIIEAVAGQIYLVAMVAMLVSMFATERARRKI
jgi:voltage-gated potassium channel